MAWRKGAGCIVCDLIHMNLENVGTSESGLVKLRSMLSGDMHRIIWSRDVDQGELCDRCHPENYLEVRTGPHVRQHDLRDGRLCKTGVE